MPSDEASCSDRTISCPDCKQELYERRWTQVILNWINQCALPGSLIQEINLRVLLDVLSNYKDDICHDELDQVLLCSEDMEPFIRYKYPILRLRNLSEAKDYPRKLYIMGSVLLYHCCMSSQTGAVDADICQNLDVREQELILKYCENLGDMEVTINNIDAAVAGAFERTAGVIFNKPNPKAKTKQVSSPNTLEASSYEPKSFPNTTSTIAMDSKPSRITALKFKSSITVMPSVVMDSSAEMSDNTNITDRLSFMDGSRNECTYDEDTTVKVYNFKGMESKQFPDNSQRVEAIEQSNLEILNPECACVPCSTSSTCCGDAGSNMAAGDMFSPQIPSAMIRRRWNKKDYTIQFGWKKWTMLAAILLSIGMAIAASLFPFKKKITDSLKTIEPVEKRFPRDDAIRAFLTPDMHWECRNNLCQKLYQRPTTGQFYSSLSRCTLLCTGPQLWPQPIGYTHFSNSIVAIEKKKLEYKFQSIPSGAVQKYLAEAFKLFLGDLARLEKIDLHIKNETQDLPLKKIYIQIDVESDPDPRLRLDTEESYTLKIDALVEQIKVTISSPSFCGVRHGLETLSQLILLDQSTGFLITLTRVVIKDGPSYRYRGLMIDTARNYIPVPDLMRTVDAMASCKLNTFHWRISDVTSFPLLLPRYPQLFEFGGYDRRLVYTVEDIKGLVRRAGVRGIRVLLEVASPGPVGRAWSWAADATCPSTNANFSCENALCIRLKITETILQILEDIYTFIIETTQVDDVFHMSDGLFSFSQCYYLLDDREDFLDKALARLRHANKGFLPKLPIIWYTAHLSREYEVNTWEKFGVQLSEWQTNPSRQRLSKFKVVHSSKWDLSCEMRKRRCKKYRTWQEMYAWKSWRNLEVLTIEGGEAILWTDLVDTSNLDTHLWPRAAAVAERLWSDMVANHSAAAREYIRLDAQRWRMLLRSVKVQPIWPVWCSFNPNQCLKKLR